MVPLETLSQDEFFEATSTLQENIPIIETELTGKIDPSILVLPRTQTTINHPIQVHVKDNEIGIVYKSLTDFFFLAPGTYLSKSHFVNDLNIYFLRLDPVFLEWNVPLEAGVHVTSHITIGIKGTLLFTIKEYDLFFTNVIKKIGFDNQKIHDWINHGIKNILIALLPPLTRNQSYFPTEDELTNLLKTSLEEFMVIFGIEVTSLQVTGFELPPSFQFNQKQEMKDEEKINQTQEITTSVESTREKAEISSDEFWEAIRNNILLEIYAPKTITTGEKKSIEIEIRSLLPKTTEHLLIKVESPGILFESPVREIQASKAIISMKFNMVPFKYGEIPISVKLINVETSRTIVHFESSIYVKSNAAMLAMRNTGFAVIFMGSILLGIATFISLYIGEPISLPKDSFSWIQAITLSGIVTVIIGCIPSMLGTFIMQRRSRNDILMALTTRRY